MNRLHRAKAVFTPGDVPRRLINLTFHAIGDAATRLDAGEKAVWLSSARFLGVLDSVADRPDVRITFDDGNASDVEYALPALNERGLRATFFVVAGRVGMPGFVDEGGLRVLTSAGMTIGCHGMRHRPWRALDECSLCEELVEAKRVLEGIVRHPVTEAACPFGSYDRRVLRALQRDGYRTVYTSDGGTARPHAWLQARNTVRIGDGPRLVEQIASSDRRGYRALRRHASQAAKRWR